MSISTLKKCIKNHGKAATSVALKLKDTNAVTNWVARKKIPEKYKDDVKKLKNLQYIDVVWMPEIARAL